MGTRSIMATLLVLLTVVTPAYVWGETLPLPSNPPLGTLSPGTAPGQPLSQQSPSYPVQPSGQLPTTQPAGEASLGSDASGWPAYPYPEYHNPYYRGSSPRDIFSGTVDWLVTFPTTLMDRVSNFLDRKVFPQIPAAQGSRSPAPGQVQPLHLVPEKPASLPAAIPYKPADGKTD